MATVGKRLVLDGRPSIPAAMDLPATRAAVDQIRTRLEKLDAAVNRAFTTLDASSPQKALESLQRQIAILSKDLENLTEQVEQGEGAQKPTYLSMQVGDDAEDGQTGPPGPRGERGEPGYTLLMDFSECYGDDSPVFVLPAASSSTDPVEGDFVLYDNTGRAMLTGDGRAMLVGA